MQYLYSTMKSEDTEVLNTEAELKLQCDLLCRMTWVKMLMLYYTFYVKRVLARCAFWNMPVVSLLFNKQVVVLRIMWHTGSHQPVTHW